MRAPRWILICSLFCGLFRAVSPGQQTLTMPPGHPPRGSTAPSPTPAFDPVFRFGYANKREAAVAALLAGETAENIGRNRERALGMFMMSIQRDPTYARVLYNLGVMSAKAERWDDALRFYREARRLDGANELGDLVEKEVIRVDVISRVDSSPDGKRQRMFDLQLVDILGRLNDPAIALDHATKLAKSDPSRWEAPAAAGIAQAALGQYDDSAKSLDAASRLAPAEWRPKLGAAAELSRQEGQYVRLVRDADAAVEKRQYENAARMYADAWQASPSRIQTGMQAAISFLMADQVSLAVQTLSRLRSVSTREIAEKAGLMLNELAAVAPEAKTAALQNPSAGPDAVVDVGERVRNTLGDIRSPEMKIATTPNPPLLSDPLKFIHVNDDQINNPVPDVVLMSSQSLFIIYQNRVGITTASPQYSAPENPPPFPGQAPAQQFGSASQPPMAITPPPQETQPAAAAPSRPRLEFRPEPYVAPPASAAPPANPPAAAPPAAAPVAPPTPPKTGPPPGAV